MKNIEFRATDKFGKTYSEKLNGRKLTRFVAKEAAKRNINEHKVIRDFVDYHFDTYYSDKEITSYEFTWLDQFNSRCKIAQQGIEIVMRNNKKEIFKRVQRFSDGKYNYTDKNNKALFNEWYEWVSHFYDGFAIVEREEDYLTNFIDKNGKLLSEEWFIWVDYFKDGLAEIHRKGGLCNFINKDGKIISSEWFRYVSNFKDGFADVERTNGEQAKIDKNGKIVVSK